MVAVKTLNKSILKTYEWISHIEANLELNTSHKKEALAYLRAVMHTLRDHLTVNELANFSAQLPIVIRGLLYENWSPMPSIIKDRSKENFMKEIWKRIPNAYHKFPIEHIIAAVFKAIAANIDYAEFNKILHALPYHIRESVMDYVVFAQD